MQEEKRGKKKYFTRTIKIEKPGDQTTVYPV
jgi:hypothetical protein